MKKPDSIKKRYRGVVFGASAGGGRALREILSRVPAHYGLPILVAQHLHPDDNGRFAEQLDREIGLRVVTPFDKQEIASGHVYVAPANYHLLVERNGTVALSMEEKVKWSRPSIDVLFDSAAHAWDEGLTAVLLSGANSDGTLGMVTVKALGGLTIAQDPVTAEYPVMPRTAIDAGAVDRVMTLDEIERLLLELGMVSNPV